MNRRRALASFLALLATALPAGSSAAPIGAPATGSSELIAVPFEVHSGDWIYLSGSGFEPRQKLFVSMYCPFFDALEDLADKYGNVKIELNGPTTDGKGEFKGFPFRVPPLHHYKSLSCRIYSSDGPLVLGPWALFAISASDQPLSTCARRMCVHIRSRPRRVRAGYVVNVRIQGWPGAWADVTVAYPHVKSQSARKQLDWQGYGWLRFTVPAGVQPAAATIQARVRLHAAGAPDRLGSGTGQFTIIR